MVDMNAIQELAQAISSEPEEATTTQSASVSRIDDEGVVWVYLSGAEKETPTASTAAEVERGDYVQVEWRNNRLYIAGNATNPAAGVSRVMDVERQAQTAKIAADAAVQEAGRARDAADTAEAAAHDAQDTANAVHSIAQQAADDATAASAAAESAQGSASLAINQLDIIENVVGVLDLLSKNGTYQLTEDTEVVEGKWYFTRTGTSPNYAYQVVSNPTGDPSAQGWYELTGIDQAVRNYVSSHLVLDDTGLWLQTDNSNAKMFLSSTDGVVLYGTGGTPVAKYGADTLIGDYTTANGFYIKLDSTNNEIGFYQGANKVAYMNGAQLYVANSLSFGNFIFYQRDNGHFTLKRVN